MMILMRIAGHQRWQFVVAGLLVWLAVTGCTSTDDGTGGVRGGGSATLTSGPVDQGWETATPAGMSPQALSAGSDGVLVGGASDGPTPGPMLAAWQSPGWLFIPVTPSTAYGAKASIVHLDAGPGRRVLAMGSIAGGAHLNPRWSAWIGSIDGLVEEPQMVETFGGPDAGGVTGVVAAIDPTVVGTWDNGTGAIGVATWGHRDQSWLRRPSLPVLAGSATELTTATATVATGIGPGVAITGLATTFVNGIVHQQGVLWLSGDDSAAWTRIDLDHSDQDSAATDVSCASGSCVAVGRLGDRLAAWRVDAGAVEPAMTTLPGLPDIRLDHYLGQPRVGVDAAMTIIAPGTDAELLLSAGPAGWVSLPTPAGEQRQVGLRDGTAFLLLRLPGDTQVVYVRAVP